MTILKQPGVEPPCRSACPAGVDVPRYVRLIGDGRFDEALAVIRERIPFPSICGHVCFSPCEAKCHLNKMGGPLIIRALKRFAAKRDSGSWKESSKIADPTGRRVAVVGSGPAGLTTAYYLAKAGHSVTVFETLSEPGGMMRVGIPSFRLPRDVLDAEIEVITDAGVQIMTNTKINSLEDLEKEGYEAFFIATGAHGHVAMGVEGEEDKGIIDCVSFLRDVCLGKDVEVGDRVAVVGGGNSAIDAARVALRLGAGEVTVVYRRTKDQMPAYASEVEEALVEGIRMQFLAAPTRIKRINGAFEMECSQMTLAGMDAGGRPKPVPVEGSVFGIKLDTIITAVGQRPCVPDEFGLKMDSQNTVMVSPRTLATTRTGVFAGGDAVNGPASVIQAIAEGGKAASAIDRYLGGSGDIHEVLAQPETEIEPLDPWTPVGERAVIPSSPVIDRIKGFSEVELDLDEETAIRQAKRCLRCDQQIAVDPAKCCGCLICEMRCSLLYHNSFNPGEAFIKVRRVGRKETEYEQTFTQDCQSCGICVRYCPYGALTREAKGDL